MDREEKMSIIEIALEEMRKGGIREAFKRIEEILLQPNDPFANYFVLPIDGWNKIKKELK